LAAINLRDMLNLEYWYWQDALSSFTAIFLAGLLIAFYNHRFLKKERRQRIADAFCVRLEEIIIDYYSQSAGEVRENAGIKFFALLDAFSLFIKNDRSVANDPEIQHQWDILVVFGSEKEWMEAEKETQERAEAMTQALCALAVIRYRLTR